MPDLKLGVAATDLTPDGPCDLSGYAARTQPSVGVHDPVWARALFFEEGRKRAVLLACDLIGFEPERDARIRERLCRELGLAGVILSCTHSHAAPASMRLIECGTCDEAWLDTLEEKLLETARNASEELKPVTIRAARTEAPVGMNRRALRNGAVTLLSREEDRPEGSSPGPYDPDLTLLQFVARGGSPLATLMNHACHSVALGHENRYISCDFPGVAVRSLECSRDPGGYGMPLFVQGACGDINPDITHRGWVGCERVGIKVAEAAREAMRESAIPIPSSPLQYREREVTLPLRNGAGEVKANLSALSVGDAAFVTLPGEAFCEQGMQVREGSPFPFTVIAAYSNGNVGYLPTREAYPLGGYEVDSAYYYYGYPECVAPEAGESCVQVALELLEECRREGE